ncbi:protein translocase subunit SecD [Telmatospirillum sp. J64-1]|uniref:protein translocase subunit SecD n=1 Tax=Telmatospirillum sp. J64-1 TaxID=2502183 RepID=UPI00115F745E|nr:protein translocase subunit SecD [Telmatospirillum sp. J64-1]
MIYFSKWKIALILAVCLAGFVFAAPNLLSRQQADQLPDWYQPVNLGLDLQGGSHLLLEVDVQAVLQEQLNSLVEAVRNDMRQNRIRYADLGVVGTSVQLRLLDQAQFEEARNSLRRLDSDVEVQVRDNGLAVLTYTEQAQTVRRNAVVNQSIEIVRRRIDELGTREPTIQRQGEDRILVQLPGVSEPERVKELLGRTAVLSFHLVDHSTSVEEALRGRVPPGSMLLPSIEQDMSGQPAHYVVRRRVELSGDLLVDSQPAFQDNRPVVSFRFNTQGARRFGDLTQQNVNRQLAIVLDNQVISAPSIREPILGGSGVITGRFSVQEANDLALLLRAGALPAPLVVLEERTVGPDLGADSIRAGQIATVLGLVLVLAFMLVAYGTLGVFANIALLVNLALLLGALSLLGATLTLPGIAGIVLTLGMAVDANVLIFERIREEMRNGRSLINAVDAGFKRAIVTILDSNLTTLVAAILLFQFGSGPVRGFAVTLAIGLVTSMFTAVWVTRLLMSTWLRYSKPKSLPV